MGRGVGRQVDRWLGRQVGRWVGRQVGRRAGRRVGGSPGRVARAGCWRPTLEHTQSDEQTNRQRKPNLSALHTRRTQGLKYPSWGKPLALIYT